MRIDTYGAPGSRRVLVQPVDDRDLGLMEREVAQIARLAGPDFSLMAVKIQDWNRELSPWAAPAVFGREGFAGEAEKTLTTILSLCADENKTYYLGGYSLAGLFALWAACRTERFAGVAAASPSVWFPGFGEYVRSRGLYCPRVYLSLGDREEKTRNPVMASVGDRMRELAEGLQAAGKECILEWNPGNHFRDPELRTARAFAWVLREELRDRQRETTDV